MGHTLMMTAWAGRLTPHARVNGSYLDDDRVGGQVDPPGEGRRADNDAHKSVGEVALDQVAVLAQHAGVVNGEPVGEQLPQLLVATLAELWRAGEPSQSGPIIATRRCTVKNKDVLFLMHKK